MNPEYGNSSLKLVGNKLFTIQGETTKEIEALFVRKLILFLIFFK